MSGQGSDPMSGPALSTRSALELEDIDFSFAARFNGINGALYKDFSLRIEQGSIVTIMGASGAGKSTLGRIMAGIVIPQKGIVRRSPDFTRPSDLVYVDQHPMNGVFPWQTVLENVRYPLEKLQVGKPRAPRPHLLPDDLVPAERACPMFIPRSFPEASYSGWRFPAASPGNRNW